MHIHTRTETSIDALCKNSTIRTGFASRFVRQKEIKNRIQKSNSKLLIESVESSFLIRFDSTFPEVILRGTPFKLLRQIPSNLLFL